MNDEETPCPNVAYEKIAGLEDGGELTVTINWQDDEATDA